MVTVVVVVLLYGCQFLVFGEWVGVVGGQHCYCKIDKNLRKGRREERKSGRWCGRKEEREGKKERECLYFFSVLILAGV